MNTFVITDFNAAMLPRDGSSVNLMQIDAEVARDLAKNAAIITEGLSHVQIIINGQLDIDLPAAASPIVLGSNVRLILARYDWASIPPGTLELPPGSIDWWIILTV